MKKKIIAAIIIIALLVVAVFVALNINKQIKESNKEENNPVVEKVTTLPQLKLYIGEEQAGSLTGYTMDMNTSMLRDTLAVTTAEERKVELELYTDGEAVKEAKYEIRTVDGERLIDSGNIAEFAGQKSSRGEIPVSSILENNKEYALIVILSTTELEKINYYTRVMVVAEDFVKDQMDFAKSFSDYTMDDQKASELINYLEPDASLANNNLGTVTLSNSYSLLTWGKLSPEKITDTEIKLKEVYVKETGVSGTYELKYRIEAEGNNEVVENYDVTETITVWTFDTKQYVLAYEREMNQIWEVTENTVKSTFLDLGIQNETVAEYVQSSNGAYIAFVVNGQLWLVNLEDKKFTNIYSVDSEGKEKTDIIISDIDDDGNVEFIICGYSQAVEHIGKNGISVCKYEEKNNHVEEEIFITYDRPVDIFAGHIGNLCYINDDVLYLMLENTIYYVNLTTKETGKIAESLEEGTYAMNSAKNTIAYNTGGNLYESDSITIINLKDNTEKKVEAGEGYKIKVCGYSGENLVYGIAPVKQVNAKKKTFNMSEITILDDNLDQVTSYSKDNIYISDVEITDTVIHLKRIKKGQSIEDDQLLDNTEKAESVVSSSYYDDTKKNRELALSLKVTLSSNIDAVTAKMPSTLFHTTYVEMIEKQEAQEIYRVYALGKLKGTYENRQEAEQQAKEENGLVVDANGEKIWTFEENYN